MLKSCIQLAMVSGLLTAAVWAEDFRVNRKITQLSGEVAAQPAAGSSHAAQLNESFVPGDLLTTGPASRAELTSADQTVIRVGSNSIFSFSDQTRQMILRQGSMLFHTPHGQGGGVIQTSAISAAVSGSTVSVCTTSSGGAKVVPLESPCIVTWRDGRQIARLNPGQMLALIPGTQPLLVAIDLGAFVKSSGLVNKFAAPLEPGVGNKIQQNVEKQEHRNPEKSGMHFFDEVAMPAEGPNPRPPPQALAPLAFPMTRPDLSTVTFDTGLAGAFRTNRSIAPGQLNALGSSVYRLVGTEVSLSPLSFIQSTSSSRMPSGYFNALPFSDQTLATFGITPALSRDFSLPPGASQILGQDVTLVPGPYNAMTAGRPGDPDAADLSAYQPNGLFGLVAAGNLTFAPAATDMAFSLINAPNTVMFGSGGAFTLDNSRYGPYCIRIFANDTQNLIFGSLAP